ncbi:MAG: hypothetical protein CMJ64_10950 [Planctomycetaceae bacterium]|nr:hypothetical protein [Planctomycetaceae bacterium]
MPRFEIRYARLRESASLVIEPVIKSLDATLSIVELEDLESTGSLLINCLGAAPYELAPFLTNKPYDERRLIFAERDAAAEFRRFGRVAAFPMSYRTLRDLCLDTASKLGASSFKQVPQLFTDPVMAGFDIRQ